MSNFGGLCPITKLVSNDLQIVSIYLWFENTKKEQVKLENTKKEQVK